VLESVKVWHHDLSVSPIFFFCSRRSSVEEVLKKSLLGSLLGVHWLGGEGRSLAREVGRRIAVIRIGVLVWDTRVLDGEGLNWDALDRLFNVLNRLDDGLDNGRLDILLLDDFLLGRVDDLALNRNVFNTLDDSLLRNVLDVAVLVHLRNVLDLMFNSVVINHLLLASDVLGSLDRLVLND